MPEEEIYEFREGILMKFNPVTGEWEEADKKPKEWAVLLKWTKGATSFSNITHSKEKRLLKCLVSSGIPTNFKVKPTDSKRDVFIEIPSEGETEVSPLTLEQANKLKSCLEPLSDLISAKVKKLSEIY
jgi:hypothetical protein